MRYRILLLASLILAVTLAMTGAAQAEQRNLQRKRVAGVVESINGQQAFVRTDQGARVGVRLGPESYWRERGYRLRSGSRVTVDGWCDEANRDWYFAGSISGPGFYFELSNGDGIPYWVDDDDYYYGAGWGPCCETYDVWYGRNPYPYRFIAPPPPPRYYVYWGPRWRQYHPYRHYDGGWNRGSDRRGNDHGNYRDRNHDGRRDDNRGDYRNRGSNDRRDDRGQAAAQPRGGPRGHRRSK